MWGSVVHVLYIKSPNEIQNLFVTTQLFFNQHFPFGSTNEQSRKVHKDQRELNYQRATNPDDTVPTAELKMSNSYFKSEDNTVQIES